MEFDESKAPLQVEMQKMSEHDVVSLRKEGADQLAAFGTGGAKVMCAQLMLFLAGYTLFDRKFLRCKRVFVIAFVKFRLVIEVDFENVMGRLT